MNEILGDSVFFGFALSLFCYYISVWIAKKVKLALFNPLLICTVLIIVILLATGIEYETYNRGAQYITYFLTPATVCLAVPLYRQFQVLKENVAAIVAGILGGCAACMVTVLVLAGIYELEHSIYASLLPKSITTAIAMGVSEEIGGISSVTVMAVVVTGILGAVIAPVIFKIFRIHHPVAQGLACGTAAHAIGTSKALELGEIQGAMSSLSIVVAGVITVIAAPLMAGML